MRLTKDEKRTIERKLGIKYLSEAQLGNASSRDEVLVSKPAIQNLKKILSDKPTRHGAPWTSAEIYVAERAYKDGHSIAEHLQRATSEVAKKLRAPF